MTNIFTCFDWNDRISLYIHVPFCRKKCSYCAFFSVPCPDSEILDRYTTKLVHEIDAVTDRMKGKAFYTAFIGGGNPGCLGFKNLKRICESVCKNGRPLEFTSEINPESFCTDMGDICSQYLTRLSMGVQSLSKRALSFLGRNADSETTRKGMENACRSREEYGFSLNFDLITCLPEWHNGINDVMTIVNDYHPDHLSVYALTLEEGTPLFLSKPVLPNSDRQADILEEIWNYLDSSGYEHYEISNFAKMGHRSIHNCVYWNYGQYIGLGPGASSTGFVSEKAWRIIGNQNIELYTVSPDFTIYETEELSDRQQLEEFILMGMRCKDGLDLKRLKTRWNKSIISVPDGYRIENDRLIPSDTGFMTSDAASYSVDSSL